MSGNPPKLGLVDEPPRVAGGWDQLPFIYHAAWAMNDYVARAIVTTNVSPDRYAQAFGTRRLLTLHNTLRATLGLAIIHDPASVTTDADGRRLRWVIVSGAFMPAIDAVPASPPVQFGTVAIHSTVMDRVDAVKGLALRSPVDRKARPELLARIADYWFTPSVRGLLANAVETLDVMLPPEGKFVLTRSSRRRAVSELAPAALPAPAARPARPAKPRKKGRRAAGEAEVEADARLSAAWEAARSQGALKREFCEGRGVKIRDLDRALDRTRKRGHRSE